MTCIVRKRQRQGSRSEGYAHRENLQLRRRCQQGCPFVITKVVLVIFGNPLYPRDVDGTPLFCP